MIIPVLFAIVVILLLLFCYKKAEKKSSRALIGSLSVIYAFSGSTILAGQTEMGFGLTWPRMVLFGAECPTTIFLIGLFIGSIPKVNRPLFVIVSLNAMATGFSVAMNGAAFDYLYAVPGIAAVTMIIKDFKRIFCSGTPEGLPSE